MKLYEIDRQLKHAKTQIDSLYQQFVIRDSYDVQQQLLDKIAAIYPTGYANLDATLNEYRDAVYKSILAKLTGS